MKGKHRLRVHDSRVLRKTFGAQAEDVTGNWWRLHKEEIHNVYSLPNVIRVIKSRIRMAWHVARKGEKRCIMGFRGET
jgi:hypothetical protein